MEPLFPQTWEGQSDLKKKLKSKGRPAGPSIPYIQGTKDAFLENYLVWCDDHKPDGAVPNPDKHLICEECTNPATWLK